MKLQHESYSRLTSSWLSWTKHQNIHPLRESDERNTFLQGQAGVRLCGHTSAHQMCRCAAHTSWIQLQEISKWRDGTACGTTWSFCHATVGSVWRPAVCGCVWVCVGERKLKLLTQLIKVLEYGHLNLKCMMLLSTIYDNQKITNVLPQLKCVAISLEHSALIITLIKLGKVMMAGAAHKIPLYAEITDELDRRALLHLHYVSHSNRVLYLVLKSWCIQIMGENFVTKIKEVCTSRAHCTYFQVRWYVVIGCVNHSLI